MTQESEDVTPPSKMDWGETIEKESYREERSCGGREGEGEGDKMRIS